MVKTKIVATIGPSSFNEELLIKMAENGLSTIRINTAHVEPGYITEVNKTVMKINKEHEKNIGIMVDLKGPELRTGIFQGDSLKIDAGKKYSISDSGAKSDIQINYRISDYIDSGTIIAINDGKVRFNVNNISSGIIMATALDSGSIRSRSRVNIPGKYIELGVLTDRDKLFLDEGLKNMVNFYALSFVQTRENVYELEDYIYDRKGQGSIISKIETKSGYDNIESIVRASDFIMVARGDLGVELPLTEVAMAQKQIIKISHRYAVPTIVATQMLESMVNSDSPTRAEVSDVTNAIIDDTDAVMLSEETAIGKYPLEAVSYLYNISRFVESHNIDFPEPESFFMDPLAFSIAKGVRIMSQTIDVNSIMAFTKSGHTARIVSAIRPAKDIYGIVPSDWVARYINLMKGITPIIIPEQDQQSDDIYRLIEHISMPGVIKPGDKTIIVSGSPALYFGGTNSIRVISIGTFVGRGYPVGKSVSGTINYGGNGTGNIILLEEYDSSINFSKYDGIIIKSSVTNRIIDQFMRLGKTLVYGTEITSKIDSNKKINIDGDTGIITYIN
ncbi:MAG: pyruvate kinase [Ferroplasma sp.]